jgi:FtsP/CotA-like multicopper oxidase with cupredoxin domain
MLTRREFLKLSATTGALLAVPWPWPAELRPVASVQIPQTPLPGKNISRFVEPVPTFVGARVDGTSALTVSMEEFQQKVLPASFYGSLPTPFNQGTYVWGYKISTKKVTAGPLYPGFTVEAQRGTPTKVTYSNNLQQADGSPPVLQKYITVDQTIHWADPLMQMGSFAPYAGPAPAVPHLHGGEVPSSSDGGPESWFTPRLKYKGSGYVSNKYTYPNDQEATTLWFHDHALGATRLNVYCGLAAFYFLRDPYDTGIAGTGLNLPAGPQEIELVIQDRQFDTNGQWFFPDSAPGGLNGPPPNPDVHPYWIPEFFGDAIVVNGKTWPYLEVEPRRYRFRLLDGCNARFLQLRLRNLSTQAPGPAFWQIGTDGGLLDEPVLLNDPANPNVLRLLLAPGERADLIIDFKGYEGQTLTLVNQAKAPYPSGSPPDPQTSGQIMQFRVGTNQVNDTSYNPATDGALRGGANQMPLIVRLANPTVTRQLTLNEVEGPGGPLEVLVNNTKWDGKRENDGNPIPGYTPDGRGNWLSELPQVGATEVWELANLTGDAHPIHLHLVQFQILNRQAFNASTYLDAWEAAFPGGEFIAGYGSPLDYGTLNADGALGGNPALSPYLQGPVLSPDANELGWKDTFKMYPGQVTRVIVRWAPQDVPVEGVGPGQNLYSFDPTTGPGYVWHCHIIDHEDNEMMRPYHPV